MTPQQRTLEKLFYASIIVGGFALFVSIVAVAILKILGLA